MSEEISWFEVLNTYSFVRADVAEGLNYSVDYTLATKHGEVAAKHFNVPFFPITKTKDEAISASDYLEYIYRYQQISKINDMKRR